MAVTSPVDEDFPGVHEKITGSFVFAVVGVIPGTK